MLLIPNIYFFIILCFSDHYHYPPHNLTLCRFADPVTSFTEFTEASPFFWRALDAHQKRVNAIGKRLKSIERLGSQLCEVLNIW